MEKRIKRLEKIILHLLEIEQKRLEDQISLNPEAPVDNIPDKLLEDQLKDIKILKKLLNFLPTIYSKK